ncbi:oligosaccharide flippase family protein [[Clostridium] symbiosum]|uniref:lipopolysaccharide biosynthesis protein n=1 Tax=Clostridium symbiosum TaxID=1512 RepID=UPI00210DD164|nr:oligosaccharide flippase family protein [[Clostridium] symbiosum]MCQ4834089.1 oligosaccharide flippase family protein [[Clostridium] symbiosum]
MLKRYRSMSVIAKAAFWALFANILQKGIGILATPVFTRILTAEEFAQYTLYQSWHDIFIIFATLNVFNYAIYTAMVKFEDDRSGFITSAQTLTTGLSLLCFVVYFIIQMFSGDILGFPLPVVALMFADILFISAFNLWCGKVRFEFRYRLMTVLSVLVGIAGPVLGMAAVHYVTNKGYGRIYGVAAVNIAVGFFLYLYNIKKSQCFFEKKYWKFIFVYCIPLIPHFLSTQILTRFDRIMINDMCGAAQAGIYSLAYSLSNLMTIVNDGVLKALTPWTYHSIKEEKPEKLSKVVTGTLLLVAGANSLLILFAPEAVKLFAPPEYYEAIYIIPAVSASVYFMYLFNIFANIEYYFSETCYVAMASIAAAVLNVILNMIFIKRFGYIAAGYTTLFSYILYAAGHFVFMRRVSKKHSKSYQFYDNKSILVISVIFVTAAFAVLLLYQYPVIRWGLLLIIVFISFCRRNDLKEMMKNCIG